MKNRDIDLNNSVFSIKNMIDWKEHANNLPEPRQLIGSLIMEGEMTFIFSESNLGKSIFGVQCSIAIATGENIDLGPGIELVNQAPPKKVLYLDFELGVKLMTNRWGNELHDSLFFGKLKRGEILEGNPKEIFDKIRKSAESYGCDTIVIDNASAISSDLEKSENAVLFMKQLSLLSRDDSFTVILITHTPKRLKKDPLTLNSISGSSKLNQLTDAAIGIGEVDKDEGGHVYLIQLKNRNDKKHYNQGNVIRTQVIESEEGYVRHVFQGCSSEMEAISGTDENLKSLLVYQKEGSYRKAAKVLGVNHNTVKRRVDKWNDLNENQF